MKTEKVKCVHLVSGAVVYGYNRDGSVFADPDTDFMIIKSGWMGSWQCVPVQFFPGERVDVEVVAQSGVNLFRNSEVLAETKQRYVVRLPDESILAYWKDRVILRPHAPTVKVCVELSKDEADAVASANHELAGPFWRAADKLAAAIKESQK